MEEARAWFVEAALRYAALWEAGQPISLDTFVAREPAETRAELRAFLEFNLTLGELDAPAVLTPEQEARADHVIALARGAAGRAASELSHRSCYGFPYPPRARSGAGPAGVPA